MRWVPSFPHSGHTLNPQPGSYGQQTPMPPVLSSAEQTPVYNYGFKKTGSCWVYVPTPPLRSPVTLGKLLAHSVSVSSCKWGSLTPVPRDWDTWMNSYM